MTAPRTTYRYPHGVTISRAELGLTPEDGVHGDHRLCPPHLCRAVVDQAELQPARPPVHNHGPDEGPGIACPEHTVAGRPRGACLDVDRLDEARPPEPVELFGQLVREVDAGRALLVLTEPGDPRRRAALDALAMARAVLDDARDLYAGPKLVQR